MDVQTLGAALAIAKSIPGTALGDTVAAANRAEAAAQTVQQSAESIAIFENTGLTVQNGKLCVRVERT